MSGFGNIIRSDNKNHRPTDSTRGDSIQLLSFPVIDHGRQSVSVKKNLLSVGHIGYHITYQYHIISVSHNVKKYR